jgi:nucleoside-diphosphate-sugar epimerase
MGGFSIRFGMQSGKDETMKTAITGGTGFIGRPLVKTLLEGGDEVRVLSRRPADTRSTFQGVRWYQGDFCHPIDPAFLRGVDTLYHLAAELNKPEEMEAVNVQGTANLLSAATKAGVRRWIQLSSIGVYGPPKGLLVTEETTPEPANEYERTKLASDRLLDETCQRSDMDYVILRPSNVIGAEMKNGSFFALVKAVSRGRYFFIGPRGAIATYVHVEDVVHALVACQKAPKGGVYNLSSDCTWEVLIERIASLVGVRPPRLRIPALPLRLVIGALEDHMRLPLTSGRLASLTSRSRYSSDRIFEELGFAFAKPMPEGIEDVVKASL